MKLDYVIYGLWIVFWAAWLVAALSVKRAAQSRMGLFVGLRIAGFVIVYLLIRFGIVKGHRAVVNGPVLQGVGMVLFLSGLGLAVWARVHLGRNWGTPMSEKLDAELVTSGPYQYIRNPIYSGIILAAIGTMVAISWYWLVIVVADGYLLRLQRNRRGANPGATLSRHLPGIQALDQEAGSLHVLTYRVCCCIRWARVTPVLPQNVNAGDPSLAQGQ